MKRTAARRAYIAVNIIFVGVILLIMGYSFFYSPDENEYPVVCLHEKVTGEPCPSCGMSHAFSLIVRGRITEALQWNGEAIRVFFFFALQLALRIILGIYSFLTDRHLKIIIISDAVFSSLFAIWTFYPFMRATWLTLF